MKQKKKELIKRELRIGVKFLAVFLASYFILSFIIKALIPMASIEFFTASTTKLFLDLTGLQSTIVLNEPVMLIVNSQTFLISELCTGLMELILIISAITASLGIHWKKRLIGILFGIILILIVNPLRIFITILTYLNQPIEITTFVHDFLFRLTLFLLIAGYYSAWFYLSVRKELKKKRKREKS
ncbi:MAG: archaeosortase/exosortase family protein [archaeon]